MTAETATPLAIFDEWRDELTGGVALGGELDDLRSRLAESQSAHVPMSLPSENAERRYSIHTRLDCGVWRIELRLDNIAVASANDDDYDEAFLNLAVKLHVERDALSDVAEAAKKASGAIALELSLEYERRWQTCLDPYVTREEIAATPCNCNQCRRLRVASNDLEAALARLTPPKQGDSHA